MSGTPMTLTHVVAYESQKSEPPSVTILASDRAIDAASVQKALAENNGDDGDVSPRQPHVKVVFEKTGKIVSYYATASGFTTNGSGDGLTGELKLDGDRASGTAKLASKGEGKLNRSFEFKFAVGLLGTAAYQAAPAAPLAKHGVSGTFRGNGQEASLRFVSARPIDPFADKPSLMLVLTERDHKGVERPDIKAGFGDFGSALVVSCHDDGSVFGCEVSHAAHTKRPFSTSGSVDILEFQIAGGQVQGRIKTNGEVTSLDEKWELDVKFAAPFSGWAKTASTTSPGKRPDSAAADRPKASSRTKSDADKKPAGKLAAGKLNVKELAILQGVENVEYKQLVQQITFASGSGPKELAAEFSKKLEAQGWRRDGSDLVAANAILNRKLGDATLTIIIKPAGDGSQVLMMTKGLAWE
jgi:hypothetical protein